MAIAHYLKEIGRGERGARDLSRAQARDLMSQLLRGELNPLEIGAFCIAMRFKGESADELAGFLDAIHQQMWRLPASATPVAVLPAYNGARKLPALLPLLARLLAREGVPVLVHGSRSEDARVDSFAVLQALGLSVSHVADQAPIEAGAIRIVPTATLHAGLDRLLQVRRALALRNSAHTLVKLMNPVAGPALVLCSYTHRAYAEPMCQAMALAGVNGMVLRGTEGEPVADPRRTPRMAAVLHGNSAVVEAGDEGGLNKLAELPTEVSAEATAAYIRAVLDGSLPVPAPIARQVQHVLALLNQLS